MNTWEDLQFWEDWFTNCDYVCVVKMSFLLDLCRPIQPVILDQNYIVLKNQVIKAERRVLKELGFCVHIKHPHKVRTWLLFLLNSTCPRTPIKRYLHSFCLADNRHVPASFKLREKPTLDAVLLELHERRFEDGRFRPLPTRDGSVRLHLPDCPETKTAITQKPRLVYYFRSDRDANPGNLSQNSSTLQPD